MLPGIASVPDLPRARSATDRLRLGPAKIMLSERALDPAALAQQIAVAHRAGLSVAIHAITEAELAKELERIIPKMRGGGRVLKFQTGTGSKT